MIENFLRGGESDIKNLFTRFKKRNFTGDTGQAIKNSSYQLTQNVIMKVGSLLFTIIIARLLMPELFGLYSLALSTILFLGIFSDLGINSALVTFISKSLGKKNLGKAKGYTKVLLKWKIYLTIGASFILAIGSYFIANYYYQKPLFFALLAGVIYIPATKIVDFFNSIYNANNNFKKPMKNGILFQILRLIFIPLTIVLLLNLGWSNQRVVFGILIALSLCYLISAWYLSFKFKKEIPFVKSKEAPLNKKEKKDLLKFILPLSTMALSGIFFGNIDTLMLGHYVPSKFIGFYGAAFSLATSIIAIIGFAVRGTFPIFARKEGKELNKIFSKTRNFTLLISFVSAILTYFLAYFGVLIAYGKDYLTSVGLLELFAILVIIIPASSVYDSYFISRKKTKIVMWILVSSTVLNIVLNFIGITYGISVAGEVGGIYGASVATIISRIFYLGLDIIMKSRTKK